MSRLPFQVVPVIDLRQGSAVHAVRGERARYKPLATPLAGSADPVEVALGYRRLYPFDAVYVADLDGIEGQGADARTIARMQKALAGVTIWLDNGAGDPAAIDTLASSPSFGAVIGTETVAGDAAYESLRERLGERLILSLDFRLGRFLGPRSILEEPALWPARVILMSLARVGTEEGPELDRLAEIVAKAGAGRSVYAAGGVRNVDDLRRLRDDGAAGALVATALHTGQIKTGDLEEIAG